MRAREKRYGGMEAPPFMRVSGFHTSKKVWNRCGSDHFYSPEMIFLGGVAYQCRAVGVFNSKRSQPSSLSAMPIRLCTLRLPSSAFRFKHSAASARVKGLSCSDTHGLSFSMIGEVLSDEIKAYASCAKR